MVGMDNTKKSKKLVKMIISEEQFREMVVGQRLTDLAIAKQLGVCSVTVQHWRKYFGLPNAYFNRPRKERTSTRPRRKLYATAEELRVLYDGQGLSQKVIAAKYGVNQMTISNWLNKYGIEARPDGGRISVILPKEELQKLYHDEKQTMGFIAEHFQCGESTVRQNLMRYGLQIDMKEVARRRLERNQTLYPQQMEHRGYLQIRKPSHPLADPGGYVGEHRLVAESAMGRPLEADEQVHHINLQKQDNGVENLAVLPGRAAHAEVHKYVERVGVYLAGLSKVCPEPLVFDRPVFWAGRWITQIDLIPAESRLSFAEYDSMFAGASNAPAVN